MPNFCMTYTVCTSNNKCPQFLCPISAVPYSLYKFHTALNASKSMLENSSSISVQNNRCTDYTNFPNPYRMDNNKCWKMSQFFVPPDSLGICTQPATPLLFSFNSSSLSLSSIMNNNVPLTLLRSPFVKILLTKSLTLDLNSQYLVLPS